MKSRIVIIRHGITTANVQRLYYGSTDVPLAERGIAELKSMTEEGVYPTSENAEYYTTGMLRTEQTLELIYGQQPHETIEDMKELNFGEFEMKSYEELRSVPAYQEWLESGTNDPPPGGEGISEFNERVTRGFEKLKSNHGLLCLKLRNQEKEAVSICICHGGVISAVMNYIWPDEHDNFYAWIPDPGHGYVLNLEDGGIKSYEKF